MTPERTDSHSAPPAAGITGSRPAIVDDLERRIDELEHLPEERFGAFTALDWWLSAAGALLLPYVLYIWYWP